MEKDDPFPYKKNRDQQMQLFTDPGNISREAVFCGIHRFSYLYCVVCIQAALTALFIYTKQMIHGE